MGADHHVDRSGGESGHHRLLLFRAAKAREQLDLRGERGEALEKGVVVLLRQPGGGHQPPPGAPSAPALTAARSPASVLPRPPSPATSRSIGRVPTMSPLTS